MYIVKQRMSWALAVDARQIFHRHAGQTAVSRKIAAQHWKWHREHILTTFVVTIITNHTLFAYIGLYRK